MGRAFLLSGDAGDANGGVSRAKAGGFRGLLAPIIAAICAAFSAAEDMACVHVSQTTFLCINDHHLNRAQIGGTNSTAAIQGLKLMKVAARIDLRTLGLRTTDPYPFFWRFGPNMSRKRRDLQLSIHNRWADTLTGKECQQQTCQPLIWEGDQVRDQAETPQWIHNHSFLSRPRISPLSRAVEVPPPTHIHILFSLYLLFIE